MSAQWQKSLFWFQCETRQTCLGSDDCPISSICPFPVFESSCRCQITITSVCHWPRVSRFSQLFPFALTLVPGSLFGPRLPATEGGSREERPRQWGRERTFFFSFFSMNGGHSVSHLPHSHREPAWDALSPLASLLKCEPLSSQIHTLLIPLCDPTVLYYYYYYCLLVNEGRLGSACHRTGRALWQLTANGQFLLKSFGGLVQLWS